MSVKRYVQKRKIAAEKLKSKPEKEMNFILKAFLYIAFVAAFIFLMVKIDDTNKQEIEREITTHGGRVIKIELASKTESKYGDPGKGNHVYKVTYTNSKSETKTVYLLNGDTRGIEW